MELQGVKDDSEGSFAFYESQSCDDVLVTDVADSAGSHDTLGLNCSKVELTTTTQKPDGTPGTPETFKFDVQANTQALALAATPASTAAGAAPAVIDQFPTGQHFFLKIDGIVGNSTDAKHAGWFEINGYDWGITSTATGATGTGGGSGTAEISDLLIDLALDAKGLPTLLKDAATGEHIASVELQGVKDDSKGSFAFYDLKLDDVLVTDVADSAGSHDTLALNFSKVELTTTTQKPDGSPGTPETFKFDVQANTQALALAATPASTAAGAAPAVIDQVPTGQHFFLKIDGIVGDSTDAKHAGWFEINGYDWGITSTATSATGTGGGSGTAEISDLLIDLALDAKGLPTLLKDAATGEHIASVELQGVKDDSKGSFAFYDLKLDDVLVTDVADSAGSHDTLALNFSKVELTTTTQKPDGTPGTPETFKFDVQANTQALALAATPASTAAGAAPAVIDQVPTGQHFFLKIDGIVGDSTDAKHAGWFEINGYDWGITSTATSATGTGGGSGTAEISDLLIDLALDAKGLPTLLKDAATGEHIASVELQGVKDDSKGSFAFYDLKLDDVLVTDVADSAGSHDTLALNFSKAALTVTTQKPDGSPGNKETFVVDVQAGTASGGDQAPVITTPPVNADVVKALDGSYHAGGVIAFFDPDGDAATAAIALDTFHVLGTTLPAFKFDSCGRRSRATSRSTR